MSKPIVLAGSLDTKGSEYAFVRDLIKAHGFDVIMIDFGILGDPPFQPDISNDDVARAAGSDIASQREAKDKTLSMRTMFSDFVRTYRVYAPDAIGYAGKSAPTRPEFEGYAEWLLELFE